MGVITSWLGKKYVLTRKHPSRVGITRLLTISVVVVSAWGGGGYTISHVHLPGIPAPCYPLVWFRDWFRKWFGEWSRKWLGE